MLNEYTIKFDVNIPENLFEELYMEYKKADKYMNRNNIQELRNILNKVMDMYWQNFDNIQIQEVFALKENKKIYAPKISLVPDTDEATLQLIGRCYKLIESYEMNDERV